MGINSGINSIIDLIETLRGEKGCPWDRKQTPGTIAVYLVEEVYELVDAIESGDHNGVCEELGDVLFHILFLTGLFREMGCFDIKDVVDLNVEKMTRRHPHVFGNERFVSVEEVKAHWHKIKMKEKNLAKKASILDSVPIGLPALMRAYRVSERAARTGFDWIDISGVMEKVEEAKQASEAYQLELKHLNQRLISVNHELEHLTLYDQLTGLPNRSLFRDRLHHQSF